MLSIKDMSMSQMYTQLFSFAFYWFSNNVTFEFLSSLSSHVPRKPITYTSMISFLHGNSYFGEPHCLCKIRIQVLFGSKIDPIGLRFLDED